MPKFKYVGAPCVYPNIVTEDGSLTANPGDVREFDTPPDPVWWVEDDADPVTPQLPFPTPEKEAE